MINGETAVRSGRKRRTMAFALAWVIVFVTVFIGSGVALIIHGEPDPAQLGPLIVDRKTKHWSFDTKSNYTDDDYWRLEFDELLHGEYTVYPEFYNWEDWEMDGSVGFFRIETSMYLNGVYHYGMIHDIVLDGPGGASCHEWIGSERVLEYFSNATLKPSGNVFEVTFSISSNFSTHGDGWMDIAAGPLLLYAKRLSYSTDLPAVFVASALLALPSAFATVVVSWRLRGGQY